MSRGAITVECPACDAKPNHPCQAKQGPTLATSACVVRIGRYHTERVVAAAKATREANEQRRRAAARIS